MRGWSGIRESGRQIVCPLCLVCDSLAAQTDTLPGFGYGKEPSVPKARLREAELRAALDGSAPPMKAAAE